MLARDFGITTPEPTLILLRPEFVRMAAPSAKEHNINLRPGYGVGTEFTGANLANSPLNAQLGPDLIRQAATIYGFDLLIQNPDRRQVKPNCALDGHNIIAFDFEAAFAFVYAIPGLPSRRPWELSQHKIASQHLFQAMLADKSIDWSALINTVSNTTEARLLEFTKMIPDDWRSAENQVITHLLEVAEHANRLEVELVACLKQIERQFGSLWN